MNKLGFGVYRLGFIVDFLSHATIVGFMAGAATVVCLQQLKGLLGLQHFTSSTDLVSVMESVFTQTHQVYYLHQLINSNVLVGQLIIIYVLLC